MALDGQVDAAATARLAAHRVLVHAPAPMGPTEAHYLGARDELGVRCAARTPWRAFRCRGHQQHTWRYRGARAVSVMSRANAAAASSGRGMVRASGVAAAQRSYAAREAKTLMYGQAVCCTAP